MFADSLKRAWPFRGNGALPSQPQKRRLTAERLPSARPDAGSIKCFVVIAERSHASHFFSQ
jgi:hypothetical protein